MAPDSEKCYAMRSCLEEIGLLMGFGNEAHAERASVKSQYPQRHRAYWTPYILCG